MSEENLFIFKEPRRVKLSTRQQDRTQPHSQRIENIGAQGSACPIHSQNHDDTAIRVFVIIHGVKNPSSTPFLSQYSFVRNVRMFWTLSSTVSEAVRHSSSGSRGGS